MATDYVSAKIMGLNPYKISHLKLAASQHLGSDSCEIFGKAIADAKIQFNSTCQLCRTKTMLSTSKLLMALYALIHCFKDALSHFRKYRGRSN